VEKALIEIGESPRKEGESAFPEIGKILDLMRKMEGERCRFFQKLPDGTFGKMTPRTI
jgi:hypothetical protein